MPEIIVGNNDTSDRNLTSNKRIVLGKVDKEMAQPPQSAAQLQLDRVDGPVAVSGHRTAQHPRSPGIDL